MNRNDPLPGDIVYWGRHNEMWLVVGYTTATALDANGGLRNVALLFGHGELLYYTFQPNSSHEIIR